MQRALEMTARFMTAGPEDMGAASLEPRQHDPQSVVRRQLHEALQTEADSGKIGYAAFEPVFARPADLDRDLYMAAISQTAGLSAQIDLKFSAHNSHASLASDYPRSGLRKLE